MYPGSWFTLNRMVINAHYTCVQATFRIKARTPGGRDPWYLFSKDLEANFLELVDSPLSTYSTGSKGDAVVIALASHQCGPVQIQASTPLCGLTLLLVLSLAERGFSLGTLVFPKSSTIYKFQFDQESGR